MSAWVAYARAIGGRNGFVRGVSENMKLDLAVPSSPMAKASSTNPEELFACALAASFCGALEEAGWVRQISLVDSLVYAEVYLHHQAGVRGLSAVLDVQTPGVSHAIAAELVSIAYRFCPYARSLRGHVQIRINNHLLLKAA